MDKWARETGNQMGSMSKISMIFLMSIIPIVGMFVLGLIIYLIYFDIVQYDLTLIEAISGNIVFMLIPTFLFYLSYILINLSLAKYRFELEGLRIKYPLRRSYVITWGDFQQICVCYAGYTTFGPRKANTVICAVKKGERRNIYGRWKTTPFRYKTVLLIDYNEDRYMKLKEICPLEIVDLRNTPEYKL